MLTVPRLRIKRGGILRKKGNDTGHHARSEKRQGEHHKG